MERSGAADRRQSLRPGADTAGKAYSDYEYLYRSAIEQVYEAMDGRFDNDPHRDEAFMTELAYRLRQLGFPEEEAVLHMRSHLWTKAEDEHIRAIVSSAYTVSMKEEKPSAAARIRKSQQQMMALLEKKYVFRFNTVMGYAEYRPNNTWVHPYVPADERVLNRMTIELRLEGLDIWEKDVARFVRSSFVPEYNPVTEYLYQ